MSGEDFLKVVDILAVAKVFYITITGGEPLIDKPIFRDVLQRISSYDIYCDMNSNLVDVDEELIVLMKDCSVRTANLII